MSLRKCSVHIFENSAVLESPFSYVEISQHEWGREVKLHDKTLASFATVVTANTQTFEHLFGIYDLPSGPYAAILVESEAFVTLKSPNINIRLAKKIILVPLFFTARPLSAVKQREDKICMDLVTSAFASHRFFYSPSGYDVTLSQQAAAKAEASIKNDPTAPAWKRSDRRFFWNYDVISDLINCEAQSWIIPFMSAHIEFKPDLEIDDDKFSLLFISRRSCFRQGCRFTRRGIDSLGNCANFCETEQTLLFANGKVSSYVQVRGSIPILWKSPCSLKYDPVVSIANDPLNCNAYCEDHFRSLAETYCPDRDSIILSVNLIDKKKDQQKLGIAYASAVDSVRNRVPCQLLYEWFDFHAETKKKGKWNNLSKLLFAVEADFNHIGFFSRQPTGEVLSRQRGVIRTNCMDNLDRTNVTQSLFARRSLLAQLNKVSAGAGSSVMDTPYKKFEKVYKVVWANNADAISLMYAGTGALKVDFTKTGKRTVKGMYNDVVNSVIRYYINNFRDGFKQDSIDILLGFYKPSAVYNFGSKPEPLQTVVYKVFTLIALLFSGTVMSTRLTGVPALETLSSLLVVTGIALLVTMYTFWLVFKYGSKIGERLVVRPKIIIE